MKYFKVIDIFIEKITEKMLVLTVFLMLFISVFAIILRWFSASFFWIEPLVRHLVFLCAFFGGILATGAGTHIAIDIVGQYLKEKKSTHFVNIIKTISSLVSMLTLLWLTKAGIDFCIVEFEYGKAVFWGIHSGFLVAIIPVGVFVIAIRFLVIFIELLSYKQKIKL